MSEAVLLTTFSVLTHGVLSQTTSISHESEAVIQVTEGSEELLGIDGVGSSLMPVRSITTFAEFAVVVALREGQLVEVEVGGFPEEL